MMMPPADDATMSAADDTLATMLRALGHPARVAVLRTLARQEGCMCGEIVRGLPLAQSTVSQHIKILVEAGLVRAAPNGTRICYCLDKAKIAALRDDVLALFAALERPSPAETGEGAPPAAAPETAPAGDMTVKVGTHD
ncbi:regulatory protein [Azorhizobium caulinodans ORS 571]|uniref:Regulatory protein n=3 Tax=Azorhizobium TaxID=6 RepID=A8HXI7_AZOC5|nr:regulatory protein [Azorhizobium caulinodans ORS 571]